MSVTPVRVPKQFRHWAARHGFRAQRGVKRSDPFYGYTRRKAITAGAGKSYTTTGYDDDGLPIIERAGPPERHLRILPHLDRMDIDDGHFDRWANSLAASVSPIPRSEAEFDAALKTLLSKSRKTVREANPS